MVVDQPFCSRNRSNECESVLHLDPIPHQGEGEMEGYYRSDLWLVFKVELASRIPRECET